MNTKTSSWKKCGLAPSVSAAAFFMVGLTSVAQTVPEGIKSAGMKRIVPDKTVFETDTANQNNWEPFASVIGNSTFVVEANTFADPEDDYNQRYVLAFQPVGWRGQDG